MFNLGIETEARDVLRIVIQVLQAFKENYIYKNKNYIYNTHAKAILKIILLRFQNQILKN